jgi:hypothetical protein
MLPSLIKRRGGDEFKKGSVLYFSKVLGQIVVLLLAFFYSQTGAATVKGRVLNSRSSAPVVGANVSLIGTTKGKTTDGNGTFVIEEVPFGKYTLSASFVGYKHKQVNITVDSTNQMVEVTILMKLEDQPPIASGCIPDFVKYQSDLANYIAKYPASLTFQIRDFVFHDSTLSSIVMTIMNDTPFDVYLLKDHGFGLQMYVQKLVDASSESVQSRPVMFYDKPVGRLLHDLTDVIRVPQHQTRVVDTVQLWRYDFTQLPSGEYKFQLVYIFPQSRAGMDDAKYQFASPIASEEGIGELYCMTLRGRFESNWLPIQIK